MPVDASSRVNDILLETQKMIYAPPSREKTKQLMRSPVLEKAKLRVSLANSPQLKSTTWQPLMRSISTAVQPLAVRERSSPKDL